MKTSFFKTSGIVMLIAALLGLLISATVNAAPHLSIGGSDSYVYHSDKLNVNVNMPSDWQGKITTTENDQAVTVAYNNPGGQPVFLYSIDKIDVKTWMNVKDNLQGVHVVSNKDGEVYFVQLTDKTSIKGTNSKEFKAIVANLSDVLENIKIG